MFEKIFSRPRALLFVLAVAAALALSGYRNISTTNRIDQILDNLSDIQTFETLVSCFGSDQTLLLGYKKASRGINFSAEDLLLLKNLVIALEAVEGVTGVSSVADYLNFRRDDKSFLQYLSGKRIEKFNNEIRELSTPAGLLLSEGNEHIGLIINLGAESADARKETMEGIRKKVSDLSIPGGFHIFGYPAFEARYFQLINSNNRKLLVISLIFCTLVAYMLFKRISTVMIVLAAIILPPLFTFGLYFFRGNSINMLTTLIIPLCLIISLNTAIYILAFHFRNSHLPGRGLSKTFREVLMPCLLACLTTFIGFSSLCLTPSHDLKLFGAYSSLATLFSFLSVFAVIFSFLSLGFGDGIKICVTEKTKSEVQGSKFRKAGPSPFKSLYRLIARTVISRHGLVLLTGFLLFFASLYPLCQGRFRCSLDDTFLEGDPILKDARAVGSFFSGEYNVSVILEHEDLVKPENLRRIKQFQEKLLSIGKIKKTLSVVNLIEDFCVRFSPEEKGLPSRDGQIKNILDFYESRGILGSHLSRFRDICRVRVWPGTTDYFEILDLEKTILKIASTTLPENTKVAVSGRVHISSLIQKRMTLKALNSIGFAMAAILLIIGIIFRSPRMALFALCANMIPLVVTYGMAITAGFSINVSTIIVGTVMMGLIVDDTIHFLHFYNEQRKKGRTPAKSILNTLRNLTRPITFTSVILLTGTLIFTLADFKPIINFGAISSMMIFLAWIFDILFLPALILTREGRGASMATEAISGLP